MKKTLFLVFSGAIVIFSIISICCAPLINNIIIDAIDWRDNNCELKSDYYDKIIKNDPSKIGEELRREKWKVYDCYRHKAMYELEYSSLIIDLTLGFSCTVLGLFHYFDVAKPFEKVTGLIGFITGIIGFVLTLVYEIYSCYIFTNDNSNEIYKINGEGIFAKKEGNKFKCLYYNKKDYYAVIAKPKDLGKKQYNYKKEIYFDTKIASCIANSDPAWTLANLCWQGSGIIADNRNCPNLYISYDNKYNKFKFDRWLTTIIFSFFIIACCIGLAIIGFIIFKYNEYEL